MPRVSFFQGIAILMFSNEGHHLLPHFHVQYAEYRASIAFDGSVLAGALPTAQLRLVRRWADLHQAELMNNWQRVLTREPLDRIEPLA